MTACLVSAGALLGHVAHGEEATCVAVIGDIRIPVCEEHAVQFAESHDRALDGGTTYQQFLRLEPLWTEGA
jgi:hypothetical protein